MFISETIQAMPIKFAMKIVQLKVYMTNASPMTLTSIQGHKCVSNWIIFNLQYLRQYLSYYIQTQCYYIQTWHGSRPIHGMHAHARFDDLVSRS